MLKSVFLIFGGLTLSMGDPTKSLSQTEASIEPHSFIELSEHDALAKKTAQAEKAFFAAMHKLQDDEKHMEAESKADADKAARLKAEAGNIII
jgi:hypothetical protein